MITSILSKFGLPIVIAIASFAGGMITSQKLQKAPIVQDKKCPDCICPKQEPCNGIDFDKIKSRNVTIENKQYLTINGDTLLIDKIKDALHSELEDFKVKKCK
jgi:hypothetical protein